MQQRQNYISLTRVVAAIFVITLHTVETYGMVSDEPYWIQANLIVGIAECAVPIFFMITGATLIDYRERYSTKEFLKKRITRVIVPLSVWFLFANIFGYFMNTDAMIFPYWFFFVMVGMYLCIPLFAAVKTEIRVEVFVYVAGVSFILNYLIPLIADVYDLVIKAAFPFDVGAGYIIYVLIGYIIHKIDISSKARFCIYIIGVFGFIMKVAGTYYLSLENGILDGTFGSYTNVPCMLISISVFLLLKQIGNRIKNHTTIKILNFLSGCTMASYVMHQYVSFYFIRPYVKDIYSLVYNIGAPILNFIICVLITCILRKIPLIRKILP